MIFLLNCQCNCQTETLQLLNMSTISQLPSQSDKFRTNITLLKSNLLKANIDEFLKVTYQVSLVTIEIRFVHKMTVKSTETSVSNSGEHFEIQTRVLYPKYLTTQPLFRISLTSEIYSGQLYTYWENGKRYPFKTPYCGVNDLLKSKTEEDCIQVEISDSNFRNLEAEHQTLTYDKLCKIEKMLAQ